MFYFPTRIAILIIVILNSVAFSQDLVITWQGDSIKGKIKSADIDQVVIQDKKGKVYKLPDNSVKYYNIGFFNDTIKVITFYDRIILKGNNNVKATLISKTENAYLVSIVGNGTSTQRKIPFDMVNEYEAKFYSDTSEKIVYGHYGRRKVTEVKPILNEEQQKEISENKVPVRVRFGGDAGYFAFLGREREGADESEKEYSRDLSTGIGLTANAAVYFTKYLGIGFEFSNYNASGSTKISFENDPNIYDLKQKITVRNYIPYISFTCNLDKKGTVRMILNTGIGYTTYKSVENISEVQRSLDFTFNGSTFNTYFLSAQMDFMVTQNVALNFKMDYTRGVINKIDAVTPIGNQDIKLDPDEARSIGRISIAAGIKFYISE